MCTTKKGYVGLVPPFSMEGDKVDIVIGRRHRLF